MRLSLDLGTGSVVTMGARASYSAEAEALFARFTTPPTTERKGLINDLIVALKDGGVWSKLDAFYVMAAADDQAARRNWIADQYNLTAVSAPTFTVDRGYQGDGSSSYLATSFIPSTAVAAKFAQDSGHISFHNRTAGQSAGIEMGNSNTLIQARNTSDVLSHRINSISSGNVIAVTDPVGMLVSSRTSAAGVNNLPYRNGTQMTVNADPSASGAVDANAIRILGRSGSVAYSSRQCAAASIGGGLSAQNVADFHAALNTYLSAVGAIA